MRPQRTPVGLLGYCLLSADLDMMDLDAPLFWWRVEGGFARVPTPFPHLFPSRRHALDFTLKLNKRRYSVSAYPARLALANTR